MKRNRNVLVDLVIDGNYILAKLVYTLHKHNLLYGELYTSLENSLDKFRKMFPFTNIYFTSDTNQRSWRKKLTEKYKSTRTKDDSIDWDFVYDVYDEFKKEVSNRYKNVKVLSVDKIEGDDWISLIVEMANKEGRSTFIISNDYDIKQLLTFNINDFYINIMSNDMYSKNKIFLPENYQLFINELRKYPNVDLFNLNNNDLFIKFISDYISSSIVEEIDNVKSLVIKLIMGDRSDNIGSAWEKPTKNGKLRGIGKKGAHAIYEKYVGEFGDVKLDDVDLYENFADIICENKKISKTNMDEIIENLKFNSSIINLKTSNIPKTLYEKMIEEFNKK